MIRALSNQNVRSLSTLPSSQEELWTEPEIPPRRIVGPSEVPVHTDCPAKGIENTRNEDAPLAMTEGGIKPKRLGR